MPLAAAEPGPAAKQRADHDAGTHRQHAGRAARRCDRRGSEAAARWPDPLFARPNYRAGPAGVGETHLRMLCSGPEGIRPAVADHATLLAGPARCRLLLRTVADGCSAQISGYWRDD